MSVSAIYEKYGLDPHSVPSEIQGAINEMARDLSKKNKPSSKSSKNLDKIYPFTVVKLKGNRYFVVQEIRNRMTEIGELPDKIAEGTLIELDRFCYTSPNCSISDSGSSTGKHLNAVRATLKQIRKFLDSNYSYVTKNSWVNLDEIEEVFYRQPISFKI